MTTTSTNNGANMSNLPTCAICGHTSHSLVNHIQEAHNMTLEAYADAYPNSPIVSQEAVDKINARRKRRATPVAVTDLRAMFHDFDMAINLDVEVGVCGANGVRPSHYKLPSYGAAKNIIFDICLDIESGATQLIYGPAGTGKDAFWLNYSWVTRTPCVSIQINPDVDISKVLFSHEIDPVEGTVYKMGHLAKALTEGYVSPISGRRVPYLIVLTDVDRCDPQQGEHLRLMLDSVSKRIQHPDGSTLPVLEGTRIVATANSIGNGSARYSSAQVMDASILSRFDSKWEFTTLDWKDESQIVKAKFPLLARICGSMKYGEKDFFDNIGDVVKAIRGAIKTDSIEMEFGHRELCGWMKHMQSRVVFYHKRGRKIPTTLVKDSFRQVRGAVDQGMHAQLDMLVDTFIRGGVIDQGNTSHIGDGELVDL